MEGHPLELAYAKWGRALATARLLGRSFPTVTAADSWFAKHAAAFAAAVEFGQKPITKAA